MHITDFENLPPSVLKKFDENGHWVVLKTSQQLSAFTIDQVHEQNNSLVKSSGYAIGLRENPAVFWS